MRVVLIVYVTRARGYPNGFLVGFELYETPTVVVIFNGAHRVEFKNQLVKLQKNLVPRNALKRYYF